MNGLDLNTSVMGRRGFLEAFALLTLGGLAFGLSSASALPSAKKTEFVVINGWVLPAEYFRQTKA